MNRTHVKHQVTAAACALCLSLSGMSAAPAAGLANSASKVDVTARFRPATDDTRPRLRIRLDIADGWHVNAHPASLDFLVATTIRAKAGGEPLPLTIDWPRGRDSGVELGGTSIRVYDDNTVIPATLATAADKGAVAADRITVNVRVQACSNRGICLPPATLSVEPVRP